MWPRMIASRTDGGEKSNSVPQRSEAKKKKKKKQRMKEKGAEDVFKISIRPRNCLSFGEFSNQANESVTQP